MRQRDRYVDVAKGIAMQQNRVLEVGSLPWTVCILLAYVAIVAFAYGMTVVIECYCPVLLGK